MAVIVSGFGDNNANGRYDEVGTHDGYTYYEKTTGDYIIIYRLKYGPYSYAPAYWIEKVTDLHWQLSGAIKRYTPKYRTSDTDVVTATWISVSETTSGELSIGAFDDDSSSSSSSSSIDSSSSTSMDSSSSDSSEDYSSSSSSS